MPRGRTVTPNGRSSSRTRSLTYCVSYWFTLQPSVSRRQVRVADVMIVGDVSQERRVGKGRARVVTRELFYLRGRSKQEDGATAGRAFFVRRNRAGRNNVQREG